MVALIAFLVGLLVGGGFGVFAAALAIVVSEEESDD